MIPINKPQTRDVLLHVAVNPGIMRDEKWLGGTTLRAGKFAVAELATPTALAPDRRW